MKIKYKICGVRTTKTIKCINKTECDYVGFVFSKSRRRVSVIRYRKLSGYLKEGILKVGVFKNENLEYVKDIIDNSDIDIIQLHGDESLEYIKQLGDKKIWKAIVANEDLKANISKYERYVDKILIDAKSCGEGISFDWNLLSELEEEKYIIAGGIREEDLSELVNLHKAFAVDLSSGVEVLDEKNNKLIEAFDMNMEVVNKSYE